MTSMEERRRYLSATARTPQRGPDPSVAAGRRVPTQGNDDGSGRPFSDINSWLVVYAFAFQIYGDFSGYSDIAIGSARLFGMRVPENFDWPYFRGNIASF